MVWRVMRWQSGYHAPRKWMAVLGDATRSTAACKKAIVAVARQLAVDASGGMGKVLRPGVSGTSYTGSGGCIRKCRSPADELR